MHLTPDDILHQARREARQSTSVRRARWMVIGTTIGTLLCAAGLVIAFIFIEQEHKYVDKLNRTAGAADAGKQLAQQIKVACDDAIFSAAHTSICMKASAVATQSVPAPPPPEPTSTTNIATLVQNAVETVCAQRNDCSGLTPQQIAVQVQSYCDAHNSCSGPRGRPGSPGRTGAPGVSGASGAPGAPGTPGASGAPGQNATDTQVAAAVTAYCDAHNACQGPQGPPGSPAPSGMQCDPGFTPATRSPLPPGSGAEEVCSSSPAPSPSPS